MMLIIIIGVHLVCQKMRGIGKPILQKILAVFWQ